MTTRKTSIGLLLLTLLGAGIACGDGNDEAPPDSGDDSFGGRRDAGRDEEDEDAGDEARDAGSEAGEEDSLTASEAEAKARGWVSGCFKKPKSNEELLNSCATGFREFDESLYPASWKPGQLPALP
jgi:hypothetical protein